MSFFKKSIFFSLCWVNICEAGIIASGIYENQDRQQAVLTATQDNYTWQTISPWVNDENILSSGILQAHCSSASTCVATGWLEDRRDLNETGIILSSQDAGNHWQAINPFISMPNFRTAYLPGVKCYNNTCVVVGEYSTSLEERSKAIIFSSVDRGVTWQTEIPFQESSALMAVDCVENFCLAVGRRQNATVILKKENHKSWQPINVSSSSLHDVSCNQTVCAAIGLDTFVVSYDQGIHWQKAFPDQEMNYFSIHCEDSICFVVGKTNTPGQSKSLVLISKDKSKTWKKIPFFSDETSVNAAFFSPIHCNQNFCTIVGSYQSPEKTDSIILISHDKGDSWQSIFPYKNRSDIKYSFLTRVACESKTCTAVGDFYGLALDGTFKNQAAIWMSDETGKHWKYHAVLNDKDFANLDSVTVAL